MTYFLTAIFILVCLLMIGIILLQRGRGGGVAAAFSGGGGANTAFGQKTGDVFTIATVVLFAIFLLMAIGLNYQFQKGDPTAPKPTVETPTTPGATSQPLEVPTIPNQLPGTGEPIAPPVGPIAPPPPASAPAK